MSLLNTIFATKLLLTVFEWEKIKKLSIKKVKNHRRENKTKFWRGKGHLFNKYSLRKLNLDQDYLFQGLKKFLVKSKKTKLKRKIKNFKKTSRKLLKLSIRTNLKEKWISVT